MKRDAFLHGAGATAALLAGTAAAPTPQTVTTQLLWIKNVESAGLWIADANGYFRDAGIASTVLAGGPGLSSVEAIVVAGRATSASTKPGWTSVTPGASGPHGARYHR